MRSSSVMLTLALALSAGSAQAQAAGDAEHGKAVFQRCVICHTVDKDGRNGMGPNLFGVAGRAAATGTTNFSFSAPLKNAKITWTDEKLTAWVAGPARLVPGTRMAFPGITSKKDQADVVAYLKTLK